MKPPIDLKQLLQQHAKSQIGLATALGISKDSANRLVNGGRKPDVGEIERALEWINGDAGDPAPAYELINVYGHVGAGGEDRITLAEDRVLDRVEVPLGLARANTIGIRVAGDSMEPRLFSGEIVIIGKDVRPSRNGDCVVEFRDGTAIVKQYMGQRDGQIFLHQYNPDKQVQVDASTVRAIHAVLYRR